LILTARITKCHITVDEIGWISSNFTAWAFYIYNLVLIVLFWTGVGYAICCFKYLVIYVILIHVDAAMFFCLTITKNILTQFNNTLNSQKDFKRFKRTYQEYFDLKQTIQEVNQICPFLKLVSCVLFLSSVMYSLILLPQNEHFLEIKSLGNFLIFIIWILMGIFRSFITIYPMTTFCEEEERFYLQVRLSDMKFTARGLIVVDWSLIY
ncbi:hypothetical protein BDFB_009166, partial [Asbolus verrucosus]